MDSVQCAQRIRKSKGLVGCIREGRMSGGPRPEETGRNGRVLTPYEFL
jgi:hypothetical protein